jgi:hypothetical protein
MLELDFSDLPDEVEVRGTTIDLPPIRAALVDVIEGLEPAEHAQIDPRHTVLRWQAFPLAESYRVTVWRTRVQGGGTYFEEAYPVTRSSPSLSLADIPDADAQRLGLHRPGSTGAWSVEAFDTEGRWIARSRNQRSYVVSSKEPRTK